MTDVTLIRSTSYYCLPINPVPLLPYLLTYSKVCTYSEVVR